jgi:hypothetical protein
MPASRRRSISPPTEKVKPTLTHKNFGRAGSSVRAATHRKNSEFSVLSVVKKWAVGGSPRQAFSCLSWLKNLAFRLENTFEFLNRIADRNGQLVLIMRLQ